MYGQQPAYGSPAPTYNQGPPGSAQPLQNPNNQSTSNQTVVNVNNPNTGAGNARNCPLCGANAGEFPRKRVGKVAVGWGCVLLYFTGILFWIPCCIDSCKDTEIVCESCRGARRKIPAKCCWFLCLNFSYFCDFNLAVIPGRGLVFFKKE